MVAYATIADYRNDIALSDGWRIVAVNKHFFIMATGNMLLGLSRKKLGDIVFYRSNGQQRARVRVREIKNPRSAKQAVQRMVLATASKTLAALRGLYNHSFENIPVGSDSLRNAQRLLMQGYRAKAATAIAGDFEMEGNQAYFAIKGAPFAGCYAGMPLTRGRLTFNEVTTDGEVLMIEGQDGSISSQAEYATLLGAMGLEPGDQLTAVCYAINPDQVVGEFGSEFNPADIYRYARITFVAQLPEDFSGNLIEDGAFDPALIEKSEGAFPAVSVEGGVISFNFSDNLPNGFAFCAGTLVRSQKNASGVTYYNNAKFVANITGWDENNAVAVYPSYMDGADEINVGDTLYLKNAEVAPLSVNGGGSASPYTITPALPLTTQASGSLTIKRNDGTPWSDSLVEALQFNIDGNWVAATLGSGISWEVAGTPVIGAARSQTTDTLTISMSSAGYTINGVR